MGRESRRPRTLEELNRGDVGRMTIAHGGCVLILRTDLRVQQYYDTWIAYRDWLVTTGPPVGITSEAVIRQIGQKQRDAEIDALAEILRGMGVPWRWAAEGLIVVVFPLMTYNARHPHAPRVLQVSADGLTALPAGRKPRHQGQDILQWIDWWYRHRIKVPPDSIYSLAQDYAIREKRHTRADSVVVDGILRAEHLLNRVIPQNEGARIL